MRYLPPVLALVLWCSSGDLRAGLSAPVPFARLSADESKILVVRNDSEGSSESQVTNPTLSNGEEIDFLSLFSSSGVYSWPDRRLIYDIDWFCLDHELLAGADLAHLARMNRFGNDWALKFYSYGREATTYSLEQLLTALTSERFRPFDTWDWHHPWHEAFELIGEKVVLTTVERAIGRIPIGYHETHTFDLATGSLDATQVHNDRLIELLVGTGGVLIVLLTAVVLAVRARPNPNKAEEGGAPNA